MSVSDPGAVGRRAVGHALGEGGVKTGKGVHHAKAIGADDAHAVRACQAHQFALFLSPEVGGEYDEALRTVLAALAYDIGDHGGGYGDDGEVVYTIGRRIVTGELKPGDETLTRPLVESPDDILVVAAGGRAGAFSAYIPGWGSKRSSQAVTVVVGGDAIGSSNRPPSGSKEVTR